MKKIILISLFVHILKFSENGYSQGWVTEVDLIFVHDLYAYENIKNATLTFSGINTSGSSQTGQLHLVVRGIGPLSGNINLQINGLAYEPYDGISPYNESISATYSGNYSLPCSPGFFEIEGSTPLEHLYIWIRIYPRLDIDDFLQECNKLTLVSNTCSPSFQWEVSDRITENFVLIHSGSSSSISITAEGLKALGFANPYGRKYFRVTGLDGTTSPLQAVDIYYPGPSSTLTPTLPRCNDGADGSIGIEITSSYPSVIDDYVITLFEGVFPARAVKQDFLTNTSRKTFSDLPAGNYWIRVQNNSGIGTYGSCWTDHAVPIANPPKVTIASFESSDYNGYPIKCHGGNDGTLKASPSGGTGMYSSWEWTPNVSANDLANKLSAGIYQVRVQDSNACWSEVHAHNIIAPEKLNVSLNSAGGKNGFDVSCQDKADGIITTEISGGIEDYEFVWSNGFTTPALTGVGPGTYRVKITDSNGCTGLNSMTLVAPGPIDFTLSEVAGIQCPGDHSGMLEAQFPVNTIGQISYLWSSGESAKEITDKPSGIYSLLVYDEQGCSSTKYHTLEEPLPYSLDVLATSDYNGSPIRCHGEDNGKLVTVVKDGAHNISSPENYTWYKNDSIFMSGTTLSSVDELTAGTYKVDIVYNTFCKAEKTFALTEPERLAVKLVLEQPTDCGKGCNGKLKGEASGGTGPLQLEWSTGTAEPVLNNLCPGSYTATVVDANGCSHQETIAFEGLKENSLDLGGSTTLCVGQTHILDPGSSWSSYSWTSNTGYKSSTQRITIADAGMYCLEAISNAGCVVQDTFFLQTSRDLLNANFLLTTEAMTGDTVVMIDISWPLPENIFWSFPTGMKRLADDGDKVYGKFENTGAYEVSLSATLGECRDEITKIVTILNGEDSFEGGRLGSQPFVKKFSLYPNPNDGVFDVVIELIEESSVILTVWNTLTATKIGQVRNSGQQSYFQHLDLRPLSAGAYVLRLDYSKGTEYIRFVVR